MSWFVYAAAVLVMVLIFWRATSDCASRSCPSPTAHAVLMRTAGGAFECLCMEAPP